MRYSLLLPTRNGGALLKDCVRSVLDQEHHDFELVVSNNASEDETPDVLAGYEGDPRLRVLTQPEPIPVTDNWNAALAASRGDYVFLIGDDDLLLPGCFAGLDALLREHRDPDCLTYNAYAYAFPGFAGSPHSHWADPFYEPHETLPRNGPLSPQVRRDIVRDTFRFIFRLHLNMQTTVVSRRAIDRLPAGLFKEPFPDFYALNALALTADSWIMSDAQLLVVGVSPKSFGRTVHNADQGGSKRYLGIRTEFPGQLPGSEIVNGTHRTLQALKADYPEQLAGVEIDRSEYVLQQAYAWFVQARLGSLRWRDAAARLGLLRGSDWPPMIRMLAARLHPDKLRARLSIDRSDPAPQLWPGMRPIPDVSGIAEFGEWIAAHRQPLDVR